MKKERGFTLVELMVVVSIAALLLAWGIPAFSTWRQMHDVENEVIQLYSDLQFARTTAYGSKNVTGIWWDNGGAYHIASDSNNDGVDSNDPQIGATVTPKYPVVNQATVSFDCRGFLDPPTPVILSVANNCGASEDCVSVSLTRITIGKMNGAACNPQ